MVWEAIAGALLGSLLGGGSGGQEMVGRTETAMPEWQENLLQRVSRRAEELSGEPYFTYPGPRIAQFTPLQERSFGLAETAATAQQPYVDLVSRVLNQVPVRWSPAVAQEYMNPYTQNVIDRTMSELDRQAAISRRDIEDRLIRSGNLGGARHGVAEAENLRNLMDIKANTLAQLNQQNYFQAMDAYNRERAGMLGLAQGAAGIGGLIQQQGLAGAQALGAAGGMQQAQGQSNLDLAYQDFLRQRQYPYEQVGWLSNIGRGFPQAGQTTTTYAPQPSPLQQIAGLGIAGFGALAGAPAGSWANRWMMNTFPFGGS